MNVQVNGGLQSNVGIQWKVADGRNNKLNFGNTVGVYRTECEGKMMSANLACFV